jgi:SPOR domain
MGDDNSRIPRSRNPVLREIMEQTSGKRVGEPLLGSSQLTRRHEGNRGRNDTPSPVVGACAVGQGPSQQRQQKKRRYVTALRTGTPQYRTSMSVRCSGTGVKTALPKAGNIRSHAEEQLASLARIDRPSNSFSRQAATLPGPDERRNRDIQIAAIGGAYGADRYHDDIPRRHWRPGRVVAITVLAMAALGSASTLGFRAVSGGFPAPLPIIKNRTQPNNIAQNNIEIERHSSSQTSIRSPNSSERLVSREQQPIDTREVPKTVPRIISAIPVSSRPSDPPLTAPGSAGVALLAPAPADTAPALDAPIASAVDSEVARSGPPLASAPIPIPISSEPKKTVAVAELAQGPADAALALDAPAEPAVETSVVKPVPLPASAPVPVPTSSEPKNIQAIVVPGGLGEGDSSSHTALSPDPEPAGAEATPPVRKDDAKRAMATRSHVRTAMIAAGDVSSGGYTVQVASARSAAAAHTSYRVLRTKFADELGGRELIVRRVSLGVRGIYYRAMVGPFASMEKAVGVCKTLKAAGGNCVIQKY